MDLPVWAASVIAIAVGLGPVLAILSARSIARLICHILYILGPRQKVMRGPDGHLTHDEPAGAAASRV
jgi:hypothetical protein